MRMTIIKNGSSDSHNSKNAITSTSFPVHLSRSLYSF